MDGHRLLGDGGRIHDAKYRDRRCSAVASRACRRFVNFSEKLLGADLSWMWDETYTLPENLYLVSAQGSRAALPARWPQPI